MKTHHVLLIAGLSILGAAPLLAHHAFAAEYDAKQFITLKGSLTTVDWINPHAWLHVDVKDDSGKVVNWAIEFGSPNALLRRGLRADRAVLRRGGWHVRPLGGTVPLCP